MTGIDSERARLTRLAYRMTGSWSDAEDVVQQSYERWYRLDDAGRAAVGRPAAWFTTVTSRLCLNLLDSARVRRERYVGPWLPEPVPERASPGADPLDRITLDDSVSMALLVALESLTPAQRVSYILHEVFGLPYAQIAEIAGRTPDAARQAATSARRQLKDGQRSKPASTAEHARLVDAFQHACLSGDLDGLVAILDPNVVSVSDGNGRTGIARRPVAGAGNVARFLLAILRSPLPGTAVERADVNGTPGFALVRSGLDGQEQVTGVVALTIGDGRICNIWFMMNPDKLSAWQKN